VLHAGAYPLPGRAAAGRARGVRAADKVGQVLAFDVVELQGAGDGVQYLVGDAGRISALQPGVVLDRNPRKQRHFLAPQPGYPPVPATEP
jgi:hypothetical protein